MSNLFNNHNGARGSHGVDLTMAQVYDIIRERLNYLQENFDPDAFCQNVCCEIEKAMGIFPNIDRLTPTAPMPDAGALPVASEKLTEYEMQVLLGTSIHGCRMSPDRVFSLNIAWHRLHAIGFIDRTDGLAIITEKGQAYVRTALSQPAPEGTVPADVARLVVAARLAVESGDDDRIAALDEAAEAFAGRVSWDDEPITEGAQ